MIRVGFDQNGYPHAKNIHGSSPPGVTHVKVQRLPLDVVMPTSALREAAFQTYVPLPFIQQAPGRARALSLERVDLHHCFNRVSLGARPWGVTFESYLPRFFELEPSSWIYRQACDRLASDRCRFIVGLSRMALRTFAATNPELANDVAAKTSVIHPMQSGFASREEVERKWEGPRGEALRCLFVGNEFFRKGGLPMLRAFRALHERGARVELDVVTRLEGGDYVTDAGAAEMAEAQRLLASPPTRHLQDVPNARVLEMMTAADLFVMPTLDDTFGYVIMEAMSRGTPVITTDVRALPEICPSDRGFVIPLERGSAKPEHWKGLEHERGTPERRAALAAVEARIEREIIAIVERILAGGEKLGLLAASARDFAEERFAPEHHARQLAALYRKALDA